LRPDVCAEYKKETGHDVIQDFPLWEPCHNILLRNGVMGYENVGGDLDKVTGKRCTFAGFPIRWMKGDGSIVRIVAIVDEG
jgi:kynurenine formamidase